MRGARDKVSTSSISTQQNIFIRPRLSSFTFTTTLRTPLQQHRCALSILKVPSQISILRNRASLRENFGIEKLRISWIPTTGVSSVTTRTTKIKEARFNSVASTREVGEVDMSRDRPQDPCSKVHCLMGSGSQSMIHRSVLEEFESSPGDCLVHKC